MTRAANADTGQEKLCFLSFLKKLFDRLFQSLGEVLLAVCDLRFYFDFFHRLKIFIKQNEKHLGAANVDTYRPTLCHSVSPLIRLGVRASQGTFSAALVSCPALLLMRLSWV